MLNWKKQYQGWKVAGALLLSIWSFPARGETAATATAVTAVTGGTPELDPTHIGAALVLIGGGFVLFRERRKGKGKGKSKE